jgi:thioesterase domain-containing protein
MQWLLHGTMTQAVADALRRHGHAVHTLSSLDLPPDANPAEVLKRARQKQLDIVTTSPALAEAPYQLDMWLGRSIVLLLLDGGGDVEEDDAIDRLFARYRRLTPGRLYTVTSNRVRIRQLPSRRAG